MQVYHLNCGTMYPFGYPDDDDQGNFFERGHGLINCLLVDTGDGLALIDTGWGTRDYTNPSPNVRQFMDLIHCPRNPNESAIRQIENLGYDSGEVKHIFITHMHLDHAGGLPDFPTATVHLLADELDAYLYPRTLAERYAYRPEHRAHNPRWQTHTLAGDQWLGIDCTPTIRIGHAEFVIIPFPGHTRGHSAIAVRTDDYWLVNCGDAYGYFRQADPHQPYKFPTSKLMELLLIKGFNIPTRHWLRIRELMRTHGDQVRIFCAHDWHEFELYASKS